MVSKSQVEVLEALGKHNENRRVIDDGRLRVKSGPNKGGALSKRAVQARLTRAYQSFLVDLDIFIEYYPVFERRFKNDLDEKGKPRARSLLWKLARKIRV